MALCDRMSNLVISTCKILFLLTDFQVLHFRWSLVSAKNAFKIYLQSSWLLEKKGWSSWWRRDSRTLIWVGYAAFLFQVTAVLVVFIDVFCYRRILVRSVSSAWDHADIISDPLGGLAQLSINVQKINRSTCNCSPLRRFINLVCLHRIDVAVLWSGCCFITFWDSSLISFLVLWFVQSAETRIKNSFFAEWFSPQGRAGFFHGHFGSFKLVDGKLAFISDLLRQLAACCVLLPAGCCCCRHGRFLLKVKTA